MDPLGSLQMQQCTASDARQILLGPPLFTPDMDMMLGGSQWVPVLFHSRGGHSSPAARAAHLAALEASRVWPPPQQPHQVWFS